MNERPVQLETLVERVRALEGGGGEGARRIATGWESVDAALGGGLLAAAVHEWIGEDHEPLAILMHLTRQAMAAGGAEQAQGGWSVWIGRRCWVQPTGLIGEAGADPVGANHGGAGAAVAAEREGKTWLERSLFVDPPDVAGRLWAIDLAARCPGVAAVVAEGADLDMAATRRLQLAAEAGGTLLLLARADHGERGHISAAMTRWRVRPAESETDRPRWELTLTRCKGAQRGSGTEAERAETWLVEESGREEGAVLVSSDAADRSADAPVERAESAPPASARHKRA